jgi:hypothetical protein
MASGHVSRIKRPNTWLHRPMLQNVKKALANTEPSTHGTNRTNRVGLVMSASRVRPEITVVGQSDAIDPGCVKTLFRCYDSSGDSGRN